MKIIGAGTIIKSDLPADNIAEPPSHDCRTYAEDLNLKYIVDGKEMTAQEISHIDPNTIKDISVFKGKDSTENSVIVIELKKTEDAQASHPEVIVDGNKMTYEEFTSKYSPNDIESMTVLKNENKIIITLKKNN